ncbi:MAG: glycosyltransferase [Candidatus Thorarchaeota archaeon]
MSKLLTIFMNVYNGMPFLEGAVNSILNQKYKEFDFWIINDGSTDDSLEYLNSLNDKRLKIFTQKNIGLSNSLNMYIKNSNSEFIARLDQDDISLPKRIETQMNYMLTHPDYDVILSNINRIGKNGKNFGYYNFHEKDNIFEYNPIKHGSIAHSSILFKREIFLRIGGYRQFLYPADDLDLLIRFSENGKVKIINLPLVNYRIHEDSYTFKYFDEMKLKTEYAFELSNLRKTYNNEISLDEFIKRKKNNIIKNIWSKFMNLGEFSFRKSGSYFGNNQYSCGIIYLFIALFLNPHNAIKRLYNLKKFKF